MTTTSARLIVWTPRILGIAVTLFIGMFALDAFSEGKPFLIAVRDFAIHLTPAYLLLALVVASFRYPWIGAAGFVGLAGLYAATMSRGRLDWILAISGPVFVVGLLFGWSALLGLRRGPAATSR